MEKVKRPRIKGFVLLGILATFFLWPSAVVRADDTPAVSEKEELVTPKSELDNLKAEWEAVREQQIQMIREKEDQLEKLKEEIFAKMKDLNVPAAPQPGVLPLEVSDASGPILPADNSGLEFEAQKAALQAERQKFFKEISRQKESLHQLQSSLAEKAKQLEAERERFEQEKKAAVS